MKRTSLLVVVSCLLAVTAIAQTEQDPAAEFYRLTKAAPQAFNKGDYETARATASALLTEAESWRENWNYGNAIHAANLVLGRLELLSGDNKKAVNYLLAAGRTPGSPQLNSFGPDMLFAKEMLKADEKDAVLQYLDLCTKFWEKKHSRLDSWKSQIENGEIPDFGPNVRYVF